MKMQHFLQILYVFTKSVRFNITKKINKIYRYSSFFIKKKYPINNNSFKKILVGETKHTQTQTLNYLTPMLYLHYSRNTNLTILFLGETCFTRRKSMQKHYQDYPYKIKTLVSLTPLLLLHSSLTTYFKTNIPKIFLKIVISVTSPNHTRLNN